MRLLGRENSLFEAFFFLFQRFQLRQQRGLPTECDRAGNGATAAVLRSQPAGHRGEREWKYFQDQEQPSRNQSFCMVRAKLVNADLQQCAFGDGRIIAA